MLITPHVVRTHELTSTDLGSIYIGTQQNVGLGGPPPLIAPQGDAPGVGGAPAPAPTVPNQPPNFPPGGVPTPGWRAADQPAGAARHVAGAGHGELLSRRCPRPGCRHRRRRPSSGTRSGAAALNYCEPDYRRRLHRTAADGAVTQRADRCADDASRPTCGGIADRRRRRSSCRRQERRSRSPVVRTRCRSRSTTRRGSPLSR